MDAYGLVNACEHTLGVVGQAGGCEHQKQLGAQGNRTLQTGSQPCGWQAPLGGLRI